MPPYQPPIQLGHRRAKILGIGLSRTGTTSLHRALEILGFKSCHWLTDFRKAYRFHALTDSNIAFAYHALDIMYPGSRFILTTRHQLDHWVDSMRFMYDHLCRIKSPFDGPMCLNKIFTRLYGRPHHWTPDDLKAAYRRHLDEVLHYFQDRPLDLLTLDITRGDGWAKLCPFVDRPIPDKPFPHANTFDQRKWEPRP